MVQMFTDKPNLLPQAALEECIFSEALKLLD